MTQTPITADPGRHSSQISFRKQVSDEDVLRWQDEERGCDPLRLHDELPWNCRDNKCINGSENRFCQHSAAPLSQSSVKKPENVCENTEHGRDYQDVTRDDTGAVMNKYENDENFNNMQAASITPESPLQSPQYTISYTIYQSKHHQHNHRETRYQPQPSCNLTSSRTPQMFQQRRISITANIVRSIISVLILNTVLHHLNHMNHLQASNDKQIQLGLFDFVKSVQAEPTFECTDNEDCGSSDRICHENKCLCHRSRPIEDKERSVCLPAAAVNEPCTISEQCLGQSVCNEYGLCSCSSGNVTLYNPSTKINYCHPKRGLNEECNHDLQCPTNAFCSTKKYGCLCQNGYGPATVKNGEGIESIECLPKTCSSKDNCESEFHVCQENRCTCLATHFDPHTATCYKFGSTGGKLGYISADSGDLSSTKKNGTVFADGDDGNRGFNSILKDLIKNSDKLWLVVIILILLTLILLALMTVILRRYYLGYCWTTHKKEYEPNNESSPKTSPFNKNSINNKSFRKKTAELDDDSSADDTAGDSSSLMTTTNKNGRGPAVARNGSDNKNVNNHVKVDMRMASKESDV